MVAFEFENLTSDISCIILSIVLRCIDIGERQMCWNLDTIYIEKTC